MGSVITVSVGTVVSVLFSLVAGGVGWWFGQSGSRKMAKRVGFFFADWSGSEARDGVAAVPGVMSRLASHDGLLTEVRTALARVNAELDANGGGSVKDQTKANAAAVLGLRADVAEVKGTMGALQAAIVASNIFAPTPTTAQPAELVVAASVNHGVTT